MAGSINIFGNEIIISDNKNADFITSGYSGYMGFSRSQALAWECI